MNVALSDAPKFPKQPWLAARPVSSRRADSPSRLTPPKLLGTQTGVKVSSARMTSTWVDLLAV